MEKIFLVFVSFFILSCESTFPTSGIGSVLKNKEAVYITDASAGYSVHGGYGSACEHPGAHALFNVGTYNIYAALDGVVSLVESCKTAGQNAKYNINLSVGLKGDTLITLEYSLEPFGGTSCSTFANQILVKSGDRVKKGDIIARFVAAGTGAHVHFNLKADGATICPDLFPDSVYTSQTGSRSGCAAASSNTMCYQLTSSEKIDQLY